MYQHIETSKTCYQPGERNDKKKNKNKTKMTTNAKEEEKMTSNQA